MLPLLLLQVSWGYQLLLASAAGCLRHSWCRRVPDQSRQGALHPRRPLVPALLLSSVVVLHASKPACEASGRLLTRLCNMEQLRLVSGLALPHELHQLLQSSRALRLCLHRAADDTGDVAAAASCGEQC